MPISSLRRTLPGLLALALPVILGEIGWMAMGIEDTLMVGPLGPAAIGAVSIGSVVMFTIAVFGMGLLLGLDTLVSQAFGAGQRQACNHIFWQGVFLAMLIGPCAVGGVLLAPVLLARGGVNPAVLALAVPYIQMLAIGAIPLLFYAACRRYLQGTGRVRPVMYTLLSANLINIGGNWLLVYGHWGFPALGVAGSALATDVARVYICVSLAGYIGWQEWIQPSGLWRARIYWDTPLIRKLLGLGFPAASQICLEVGVFAAATVLAGRLTPEALAAHQIALNLASLTYMVPLGLSSAGAVVVGQAIGRTDWPDARRLGWVTLGLGAAFMLSMGVVFAVVPAPLLHAYTHDPEAVLLGTALLQVAALFQLFDGVQVVGTGVLRGLGDTRTPMIANLVGHWALGLPCGYALCFLFGQGVVGLWLGLSLGLFLVALALLYTWFVRTRPYRHA